MSAIADFTDPLISPFLNALGPMNDMVSTHTDAHQELRSLISTLTGLDGGSTSLTGLTGEAVHLASEHLIHLSEQRMDVVKQVMDAFKSCAETASSAVSTVEAAPCAGGLLEKLLRYFDLIGVLMEGKSVVDAAINALKSELERDMANPLSLLSDIISAVLDMMGGLPIAMGEWAIKVYELGQEILKIIQMVQSLLNELKALASSPIQALFSSIPALNPAVEQGNFGGTLNTSKPDTNIGSVEVTPPNINTLKQSLGQIVSTILNKAGSEVISELGLKAFSIQGVSDFLNRVGKYVLETMKAQGGGCFGTVPMPHGDNGLQRLGTVGEHASLGALSGMPTMSLDITSLHSYTGQMGPNVMLPPLTMPDIQIQQLGTIA